MRMSVVVDPVSGGTTIANPNRQSSVVAGGPSSEEELLVANIVTNSSSTPSPSPTPGASSSSLLTTSSTLSASTTTMVGQQQPSPVSVSSAVPAASTTTNLDDVVKTGNLRKVKGRKKYFVLRKESENGSIPARLEYYANERKFKLGQSPKKSIILKHCFNISRTDSKCKYAIALHTHNDCVRIAMSSEEEMNDWLRTINSLAGDDEDEFLATSMPTTDDHGTITTTGLIPKPHFEHVWLVTALNKGLGSKENIIGPYRLCLTSKELTLLKVGDHDEKHSVGILKFPLNVIRNVSHDATFGCFFHIEFGRLAPTGPGQLSLKTEDNNIAQNMHLLILKAMQNYSKDDMIPRETRRGRTYTWNSAYNDSTSSVGSRHSSFHHGGGPNSHHGTTPPIMTRINSLDGSTMRLRTESFGSQESRTTGMSPPMPIMGHNNSLMNPSLSFNSPMCSTTDSASSSYSNDYENNNNNGNSSRLLQAYNHQQQHSCGKSQDEEEQEESYVPWHPADEQHHSSATTPSSTSLLTLHLKQNSINSNSRNDGNASHNEDDYVETTVGSGGGVTTSSTSATPSSHIEAQSPISPFDNYLPMSPGTPLSSGENHTRHAAAGEKHHKTSVPHSRTSSNAIDEHEGYVPMIPGTQHNDNSAGSATGLDESYFDMDFSKKLNLSNDDFRRMSPASSESLQSSTPSSDFPLEKVSSYLLSSDDLDDNSGRPMRAYSVGSRSDTSAIGKGRFGKNRLEAVQETFRMRALSVGAKISKPNTSSAATKTTPETAKKEKGNAASITSISSSITAPLSNSWSGSTGKWPPHKFSSPAPVPASVTTPQMPSAYHHSQQNSDSVDSDLMELDFSHNKKNRKRSLPGSNHLSLSGGNQGSVGSSIGSGGPKLSPALLKSGCETPETPSEGSKGSPFIHQYGSSPGVPSSKYPCSAPISIQKAKSSCGGEGDYMDTSGSSVSILTRMTGLGVKEIKKLDNEGAYLDMNFGNPTVPVAAATSKMSSIPSVSAGKNCTTSNPVVVKPNESVPPSVFTLNTTSSGSSTPATHCVSSSPKLAFFGLTSSPGAAAPLSYFGTTSPLQATSHKSTVSPPSASLLHPPPTTSVSTANSSSPNSTSSLSRIEESPEKQEYSRSTSQTEDDGSSKITYASIDHSCLESTSPHKKPLTAVSSINCGKSSKDADADSSNVTYSEVEFVKSSDAMKRNMDFLK